MNPKMKPRIQFAAVLCLSGVLTAAQNDGPPMTNGDVVKMAAARLPDNIVVAAIEGARHKSFDLSVDGLIALKLAGVSDVIIAAMQKSATPARPPDTVTLLRQSPSQSSRSGPREPVAIQEPVVANLQALRVNESTGELIPLEQVDVKRLDQGRVYFMYVEGSASPVAFPSGESFTFITRLMGPAKMDDWPKFIDDQRKRSFFKLEHLAVRGDRRFATGKFVSMTARAYGEIRFGTDPKKPERGSSSFLFVPQEPLPPGEYVLDPGGYGGLSGFGSAFRVVQR